MAEISRFYGVIIRMFFLQNEHNPPHFHAYYGDYKIEINIKTLEIEKGYLPNTAFYIVKQWAQLHQQELLDIWEKQIFKKIEPFDNK
jgi:hypothetical protein